MKNKLIRCTKCVLPSSFPMIKFDKNGVCNHCNDFSPITVKGKKEFEKLLSVCPKNGMDYDCIVCYSGGRDSTYVLYKLVKEYNLNVLAVTYDWGMMTPEAHKNWEIANSILEFDHEVIVPDQNSIFESIKMNLKAWSKRPHFGMWPMLTLFDKEYEYHINKIADEKNIPLIITAGESGFERTVFKRSIFGVEDASSIFNRLLLFSRVGMEILRNPSYINKSLISGVKGAFSLINQKAFGAKWAHYFKYFLWNESELLSLIKNEMNWVGPNDDTILTWRIDDYTPPLYNHICYSMRGFTENDTLRSVQIRQGHLSRDTALDLLLDENKPRWGPMFEYFNRLNMDESEIKKILDSIPVNYRYPDQSYEEYL